VRKTVAALVLAFAAALLVAALVLAQEVGVTITYLFNLAPNTDASRILYLGTLSRRLDASRVSLDFELARQLRSTAVLYGVNLSSGYYLYKVTDYPFPVHVALPYGYSVSASTGAITLLYTIPVNATIQPPEQPPSQPPEQPPSEPLEQPRGEGSPIEEEGEQGPAGFGEVVYHGLSGLVPYIAVALLLVFAAVLTMVGVRRMRSIVIVIEGPRLPKKK